MQSQLLPSSLSNVKVSETVPELPHTPFPTFRPTNPYQLSWLGVVGGGALLQNVYPS